MPLTPRQILNNRYRIDRLLGQGGYGTVHKAWDITFDQPCAVKENTEITPDAQRQFLREARMLFTLRHPRLPQVKDYFVAPGDGQYLVMDFVEGEDLQEMLSRLNEPLAESKVVRWITQVCDALAYLHNQNPPVIHRDIKPANIRITPEGNAMLVDFGIAKVYDPYAKTTIGAKAVSPGYSSPEQYSSETTDIRSDIYSLGSTLYGLLTGQKPPESVKLASGTATIKLPRQLNKQISSELERIILKCMEVNANQRFQSVGELQSEIDKITPPPPPPPRPIPLVWLGVVGGLGLLMIVLTAGLLVALMWNRNISSATEPVLMVVETTEVNIISDQTETAIEPVIDCASEQKLCVGLVADVGKIDDKSYNQYVWEGLERAERELGAAIQYVGTSAANDYEKNIATFASYNYDVIITVGWSQGDATITSAKKHPQIKFIGIDQWQAENTPNLVGITFPEDIAGFLAGALAAQVTKSNKIGAVLGTDAVPPTWRYGEGYRAGALYINPKVDVTVQYHNDVGFDQTYTDPNWGKSIALSMINDGVDVIFGGGFTTGDGALIGAAESDIYCIGAEIDQYFTLPEAQKCLISSAVKLITPGTFELIKLIKDGKFTSGNFSGQAGYAPFHNYDDKISPEVKYKMEEIWLALQNGALQTNVPPVKPD